MKTRILFVLASLFVTVASAQLVKGTVTSGGGISYSKSTEPGYQFDPNAEKDSFTSLEVMPGIGYFVSDGFMVGVNVGYSSTKLIDFGSETKTSGFAAGPFARYYKQTSNENFAVYGQFSFLYQSGKLTNSSNTETKNSAMDFALSPGLVYLINQHWAIELGFRGIGYYTSDPNKDVDNDNEGEIEIGLNSLIPATLGFRYHF